MRFILELGEGEVGVEGPGGGPSERVGGLAVAVVTNQI